MVCLAVNTSSHAARRRFPTEFITDAAPNSITDAPVIMKSNEQGGALQPAPRFPFRSLTCHLSFRAAECAEWERVHGL